MTTYINIEDVQNILSKTSDKYQSEYTGGWIAGKIREEINSLPSIDPQEMIREMIEENYKTLGNVTQLKELLSRLPK